MFHFSELIIRSTFLVTAGDIYGNHSTVTTLHEVSCWERGVGAGFGVFMGAFRWEELRFNMRRWMLRFWGCVSGRWIPVFMGWYDRRVGIHSASCLFRFTVTGRHVPPLYFNIPILLLLLQVSHSVNHPSYPLLLTLFRLPCTIAYKNVRKFNILF